MIKEYRFDSRGQLARLCLASGGQVLPDGFMDAPGVLEIDHIGPHMTLPEIVGGVTIPSTVVDARHHANIRWDGEPHPAFAGYEVSPRTPSRVWGGMEPPPASRVAPPDTIPAWIGKHVLKKKGLLEQVEQAVEAAGGLGAEAWEHDPTWSRHSAFLGQMAKLLGLSDEEVDDLFLEAGNIRT